MDRFFRWVIAASVFEIGLEGDVILDCEALFVSDASNLFNRSCSFGSFYSTRLSGGSYHLIGSKNACFHCAYQAFFSTGSCLGGVIPIIIWSVC